MRYAIGSLAGAFLGWAFCGAQGIGYGVVGGVIMILVVRDMER